MFISVSSRRIVVTMVCPFRNVVHETGIFAENKENFDEKLSKFVEGKNTHGGVILGTRYTWGRN